MRKSVGNRQLTIGKKSILASCIVCLVSFSFSQTIKKSSKTEIINGKKFYLHETEKKQTLYSIAKTYEVTVNDIVNVNPEAMEGIKPGQILKIPFEKGKYEAKKNPKITTNINEITIKEPNPDISPDTLKRDSIILKDNYNVAVLLPLNLTQVLKTESEKKEEGHDKFSEKSKIAIEFYQGVMMAVDSMKKQKFNCSIYVYDTGIDSVALLKLRKNPELRKMDLMIGPLHGNEFSAFSKISKKENVSIVAPMTQSNKILLSNRYVSKVTPSPITQVEQMANYVGEKYAGQNIIVVGNVSAKELNYVSTFKKTVNDFFQRKNIPLSDTVKEANGSVTISSLINPVKINVIIIPSSNESFVCNQLSALNQIQQKDKKDSIIVFGMEQWKTIESADVDYLENLHVHFPSAVFMDYESQGTKNFISTYRVMYNTEPSHYVFDGFDVTYYYLNTLKKYGANFQSYLPEMKWTGIHTKFSFYQTAIESGYENRGVYILRFQNYNLVKAE